MTVSAKDVALWNAHAKKVRANIDVASLKLLPAGGKTDRGAKPGDWFAFPLPGGGFGAAILIARPEKHEAFFADAIVVSVRRRWPSWPTLEDVKSLRMDDGAMIRQTSFISVRDSRWRGLGSQPDFDVNDWPWPLPWFAGRKDRKRVNVQLHFGISDVRYEQVSGAILALDPDAGRTVKTMSGGEAIARHTYKVLENIAFDRPKTTPGYVKETGVITPERVAAWRIINAEMRAARERAQKQGRGSKTSLPPDGF
jgi:hypothetical protein